MKQETRDRRNLLRNGAWWSAADAFTTPFLIPFALALGATNVIIGMLSSLQQMGIFLSQIPGSEAVWVFRKRRALNNACEFLAKTSWLVIAVIPFLPSDSWLAVLLMAVFISSFFTNLSYPAWTSFIAEVIPKKIRGRFFANRNVYMGLVGMIMMLVVGFYLDLFKGSLLGFSSIFVYGALAGFIAIIYFSMIKGTKLTLPEHRFRDYLSIGGNFRRFLEFNAFFGFSYMIASPFFAVYMLDNLGMDYASYVMFAAIAAFAGLASQKHWGKVIDRYGEKPTLIVGVLGAAIVPVLFIFINQANLLLLIPVQMLSGAVWAGIGLTTFAMFLDTTESDKRLTQVADYNMVSTLPMAVAPLAGGFIAQNFSFVLAGIPLVFLLSSVLRLTSLLLLKRVKEPHVDKEYSAGRVFRTFMTVHPARGMVHQVRVIDRIVDKEIGKIARKL